MDKLLASEESSIKDVDLGKILGHTQNGQWLAEQDPASSSRGEEEEEEEEEEEDDSEDYVQSRFYSSP